MGPPPKKRNKWENLLELSSERAAGSNLAAKRTHWRFSGGERAWAELCSRGSGRAATAGGKGRGKGHGEAMETNDTSSPSGPAMRWWGEKQAWASCCSEGREGRVCWRTTWELWEQGSKRCLYCFELMKLLKRELWRVTLLDGMQTHIWICWNKSEISLNIILGTEDDIE